MKPDEKKIDELLARGVSEIIVRDDLKGNLFTGKKLRVKFGIDPTGDCLHIGHAVALLKLKELQDLGHTIILLIGDHTAQVGDPSGRSKERPNLTRSQIKKNMASYREQAALLLDIKKAEIRYNSEWYDRLTLTEIARLTSTVSVAQVLQRADFKRRIQSGQDVSLREALYPLLQGYDSVMLKSDIEIGGTDQKFNLLMSRQIQGRYGQKEQDIIMIPLLEGLDGTEKMSKSSENYIALTEASEEMYSRVMSIPDSLLWRYFDLATRVSRDHIEALKKQVGKGANPRDAKMQLAYEITSLYHGRTSASTAQARFVALFQKHETPEDMPALTLRQGLSFVEILVAAGFAASKGEGKRLIKQGGVAWDEKIVTDETLVPALSPDGTILKKGKRHFVRIIKK